MRIRSALTAFTSSLPVGFDGFVSHGSIRIVLPLGRSTSNAAWPYHFTVVFAAVGAAALPAGAAGAFPAGCANAVEASRQRARRVRMPVAYRHAPKKARGPRGPLCSLREWE